MIELSIKTSEQSEVFQGTFPESWEEVPAEKVYKMLRNVVRYSGEDAKFRSFFDLVTFQNPSLNPNILRGISIDDAAFISDKMNWIFRGTTRCLVPEFKANFTKYHGPADKFKNGTNIEFGIADDIFEKLWQDKDKQDSDLLDLLTLTLYRPATTDKNTYYKNEDHREPLISRKQVEDYLQRAGKKIPAEVKMAAFLYWAGVKAYVDKLYGKWLFVKQSEESEDDPKPQKQSGLNFGWWGIWQDIAENGLFGKLDEVHQENFHNTCLYLVKKKEEQLQAEKNLKLSQNKQTQL